MANTQEVVRLAAVGDIHCTKNSQGNLQPLFSKITAAFHGHAHHGHPEGRTRSDITVYNVSMPLLKKAFPDQPAFRLLEIPTTP